MNRFTSEKDDDQKVSENLRKSAAPKRRRQTGINISNLSRDDLEQLVHELEIKQNELKATNQRLNQQISERKKRVNALSQRLLEAQEKERRLIGHTLHDQIGGTLAMLLLTVKQAKSKHAESDKNILEEIEKITNEANQAVRVLSHSLRPNILDDYGLIDALAWYIERYEERTGIKVSFNHDDIDALLSPNMKTVIYRIVQEAMTNALKHAKTKTIAISISLRNNELTLTIEDSGSGIDPELVTVDGIGIIGMQDLCELVGGNFVIDSSPGIGTRITCKCPLFPG
jgi:signal transduction histidine kinase